MQARLQTSNWKQCVAIRLRRPAADHILWQIVPSRGITVHFQILLLHLCPRDVCVRSDYRLFWLEKFAPSEQPLSQRQCWGSSSHGHFSLRCLNSRWRWKKMWLLMWWLGLHGTFTSDQHCRLWTGVSVTGGLTHEVQSLKGDAGGWTRTTVLPLTLWDTGSSKAEAAAAAAEMAFYLLPRRIPSPQRRAVLDKSTKRWRQEEFVHSHPKDLQAPGEAGSQE